MTDEVELKARVERVVRDNFYPGPLAGSTDRLTVALIEEFGLNTRPVPTQEEREAVARIIAEDDVKTWIWDEDTDPDDHEKAIVEATAFHRPTADRLLALLQGWETDR